MTDNELASLIRTVLLGNLAEQGHSDVQVLASNQPQNEGRVNGPAIYFSLIGNPRFGWQGRTRVWNPDTNVFDYEEHQWYLSTFQFEAFAPQNPSDLSMPTAGDLLSLAAMILNSMNAVRAFRAQQVGVQRITQQRHPYFVNDRSQFEAVPSFDFTVSHKRSIIQQTPAIDDYEAQLYRV